MPDPTMTVATATVNITSTTSAEETSILVEPRGTLHIEVVNGERTTRVALRFSKGGRLSLSRLSSHRTER